MACIHYGFVATMRSTCVLCSVFLLYFCRGSLGSNSIFLTITRNGTTHVYKDSQTFEYNENDPDSATFDIFCSVTIDTYKNGKPPIITWIEDDMEWEPRPNGVNIFHRKILKAEDDGKELKCKAKTLDQKWTISTHFNKRKNAREIMLAKPNAFKIVLLAIGVTIGAAIVILLCYGAIRCLRSKNRDVEGGSDDPVENQKVVYAKINVDKMNKNMLQKSDDSQYAEVGLVNEGCQIQESTYYKFPVPDSEQIENTDSSVSGRIESLEYQIRNSKGNKENDENKLNALTFGKPEGSSDC